MNTTIKSHTDKLPFKTLTPAAALCFNTEAKARVTFTFKEAEFKKGETVNYEICTESREELNEKRDGVWKRQWKESIILVKGIKFPFRDFAELFEVSRVRSITDFYRNTPYKSFVECIYQQYDLRKFDFQIEDISLGLYKNRFILAAEQGLGKTLMSLIWAKIKSHGNVLIVAPRDLIPQWREAATMIGIDLKQIEKLSDFDPKNKEGWYITHFEFLSTAKKETALGYGVKEYSEYYTETGEYIKSEDRLIGVASAPSYFSKDEKISQAKVVTLPGYGTVLKQSRLFPHFEDIVKLKYNGNYVRLKDKFNTLIVDEATKIKGDSNRGNAIRSFRAKNIVALSGTPVKNMIEDIQYLFGWLFGYNSERYPYSYNSQGFIEDFGSTETNGSSTRVLPEVSNIEAMWKLVSPAIIRRTKADSGIKMVKKHIVDIPVHYQATERAEYDNLKADSAMGLIWKQKGFNSLSKSTAVFSKIRTLIEAGEKVLLFTGLQEVAERYLFTCRAMGYKAEIANGTVSADKRGKEVIPNFKHGDTQVLIAGIEALNVGHDIPQCSHLIIADYTVWDASTFDQAVDRIYRITSPKDVTIHLIYGVGTIDEKMIELVNRKRSATREVLSI